MTSIPQGASRIQIGTSHLTECNANTLPSVLERMGYSTSCVGINLGDTPQGLRHPRGVPSIRSYAPHGMTVSFAEPCTRVIAFAMAPSDSESAIDTSYLADDDDVHRGKRDNLGYMIFCGVPIMGGGG